MYKKIIGVVALATMTISCGQNEVEFSATNCTIDGNIVVCPDGTQLEVLNGKDGDKGESGEKGDKGDVGLTGKDGLSGKAGPKGDVGPKGDQGIKGDKGESGKDGKDGINGKDGIDGKDGQQGPKGDKGDTGDKGDSGQNLTIHSLPNRGECVDLGDGLYGENEGGHTEVYNNSDCDHGPSPKRVLCDSLKDDDGISSVCWAGKRQFSVQGKYSDVLLYEINFN